MNVKKININQTEPIYDIASDIYDVSARNNGATFESLQSLLSSDNLSTLIPSSIRCGGMTIRFVQSSDNTYVQYRLMANVWSITESDWQGVDDDPTVGSDNLVKSGGVADKLKDIGLSSNWGIDDLSFVDDNDKAILSVQDGYPKTKNFSGKFTNENIESINSKLEEIKNILNTTSQKTFIPYRTFSILGDSYSTFKGYLTPENAAIWYPREQGDNDVVNVEETWWRLLASEINALLLEMFHGLEHRYVMMDMQAAALLMQKNLIC